MEIKYAIQCLEAIGDKLSYRQKEAVQTLKAAALKICLICNGNGWYITEDIAGQHKYWCDDCNGTGKKL